MKKVFIIVLFSITFLNADFLGLSSLGSSSNLGGALNTGTISSLVSDYTKTYGISTGKDVTSGLGGSIYSSALGSWWQSNTSWSTGTTGMCYTYDPNSKGETVPNFCSLLGNVSFNACDFLPSSIGPYRKVSASEQAKKKFAFRDWCESFTQKNNKQQTLKQSVQQNTIGNYRAEQAKDAHFGSDKDKQSRQALESEMAKVDTGTRTKKGSGQTETVQDNLSTLNGRGKGHVARDVVENTSMNTAELDSKSAVDIKDIKLPYNSLKEYDDATHFYANNNYTITRSLDFSEHIETSRAKFYSINEEYIGTVSNPTTTNYSQAQKAKDDFVENYIESENGYRKMAYQWAAQKAQDEIKYDMPAILGDTFYMFKDLNNNMNMLSKEDAFERNYKIKRQQYEEAKIMQKWRGEADKKADTLKNLLTKASIASRPFNIQQAQKEIQSIISSGTAAK